MATASSALANTATTTPTTTNTPVPPATFSLSQLPAGEYIVTSSDQGLSIFDVTGDNVGTLTHGVHDFAAISPDHKRLAYIDSDWALSVENIQSGESKMIAPFDMLRSNLAWSPSGTQLAFEETSPDQGMRPGIAVMDVTSGEVTQVVSWAEGAQHPSWSPDGNWIAFDSPHSDPTISKVYLIPSSCIGAPDVCSSESSGPIPIADGVYSVNPSWSPDGTEVVVACGKGDSTADADLCILELANGRFHRISVTPNQEALPLWSPSGEWISFQDETAGGLFIENPDGTNRQLISSTESAAFWLLKR
jgi:TolB protein